MSELMELQQQFQNFLLSGDTCIDESVIETETVAVATRLGIYKDAYKLRLIESLTTSFPAVHAYLGTEEFQKLCRSYIAFHPSTYRSIRWYGHVLSEHAKHYYTNAYFYVAELADLEWKMTLAFDAADDPVLSINDVASVPVDSWANMQFALHSSVQRLNYSWNTVPVWRALTNDSDLPEWDNTSKVTPWVLWRSQDNLIQYYSLSEEEAWALDAVIQGLSFGELCEGLCQWIAVDDVAMRAASFLKNWIQQGIMSRLLSC
ncbi:DUF2063 domain-containing protein [uncultured Legionella sp.]|uniref:HvfC/BufC N-terminal domain-containing protein n=1 Tax=uncultured Legionella sp. TaxID=210934 RepID=UPI0026133090|nr:DNA-binding domain-containing protein [uncultured Legionella sp.]